jgi:hypothetical protein
VSPNACRDRRAYSQPEVKQGAQGKLWVSFSSLQISRARGPSIVQSRNSTFQACGSAKAPSTRAQLLIGHNPTRTRGSGISSRSCTKCFTDGLIRQACCLAAPPWGARHHTDNLSLTTPFAKDSTLTKTVRRTSMSNCADRARCRLGGSSKGYQSFGHIPTFWSGRAARLTVEPALNGQAELRESARRRPSVSQHANARVCSVCPTQPAINKKRLLGRS